MSDFSVTEAALAGVGLLGRKTLAAVVWSGIYFVTFALLLLIFGAPFFSFLTVIAQSGGKPDPGAVIGMIGSIGGFYLLVVIVSIVLNAVIACAVYRAEIFPDDSRFFYMRLGASEGWFMLMSLVRGIVMFAVQMGMSIPVAIVTIGAAAAAGAATSDSGSSAGAGAGVLLITGLLRLVMYGVLIWLYLRLSLAGPMTFVEKKFRLFESWAMTRGREGPLFLVGLLVFAIGLIVYIVLGAVGLGGGFAIWGGVEHPASAASFFSQPPGQILNFLAPFIEWAALLMFVGAIIMVPIALAPWAHVYRRMRPETDVAKVFE